MSAIDPAPPTVGFVHVGPARHGVTRLGRDLEAAMDDLVAVRAAHLDLRDGAIGCGQAAALAAVGPVDGWIVQFTDHLFGRSPEQAARTANGLLDLLAPNVVVMAFHDVPAVATAATAVADTGVDGEAARTARRAAVYRTLAGRVRPVVCSHHERARLRACGHRGPVDAIHLPVPSRSVGPTMPARRHPAGVLPSAPSAPSVGVLGFVYPHKGQLDVLRACAGLGRAVRFVNLGGASPGHDDLVVELHRQSVRLGVPCEVTGWIDDADLPASLAAVDVPVMAHAGVSASASLASWLGAGRRPLVVDGPYAEELDATAPGAIVRYAPRSDGALSEAIAAALRCPSSTWHDGLPAAWTPQAAAQRYLEVVRR